MTFKKIQSLAFGVLLTLILTTLVACSKRVPSSWTRMSLPFSESKVAPGTQPSDKEVQVVFTTKETPSQVCSHFLIRLQRKSYVLKKGKLGKNPDVLVQGSSDKIHLKCGLRAGKVWVSLTRI